MADTTKVKELTSRLEQGVKDIFNSDRYAQYLATMSRFHKYSTRNTLLIHLQRPDASLVAGFSSWRDKFSRNVLRGQKAIKILAPVPFTISEEKEKLDPVTRRPIIGEDGQPVVEYIERQLARFKVANVFDVKQTDGKPLPTLVQDLEGNVEQYEAFMDALREVSPLPISIEPMPDDTDGACVFGEKISIREGMSQIQTVSAVIHEITHAKLHDIESLRLMDENAQPKDRRTGEVEAESVSYAVCQYFGIETGGNSFGYIAEWSRGRELKELNESLDAIRKTAAELIEGVENKFKELVKERNITMAVGEMQMEAAEQLEREAELSEPQPEPSGLSAQSAPSEPPNQSSPSEPPSQPTPSEPPSQSAPAELLTAYTRFIQDPNLLTVGSTVLMPPVFDNGNFNRNGKRIRVTVEESAGKYPLFSRIENGEKNYYFLTLSSLIDRTSQYFRDEWNEETRKWENHKPTEADFDEVIPQIATRFEQDMADPAKWAMYQHAAVVNRIKECEAHNVPVRAQREIMSQWRRAAAQQKRQEDERIFQEKYDARIDEIAKAVEKGETIDVTHNEYSFGGRNPVLDLFRLYNVPLPLKTQGWVKKRLAEINSSGYRFYSHKGKGRSTTFNGFMDVLRKAIRETPIEQKRQPAEVNQDVAEQAGAEAETETDVVNTAVSTDNTLAHKLYYKFAGLFPDFASGKYSYLKLEAGEGFMPLSLEHIYGDRISVMHTYLQNGDLCYDPMMEFRFDNIGKTMSPCAYEQSIPPIYQYFNDDGKGVYVDGNGKSSFIPDLQSQLDEFAGYWLDNIAQQGYMPVAGNLVLGKDDEVRVTFDAEGNPLMSEYEPQEPGQLGAEVPIVQAEQAKPEKQYDLGFGFLGHGITVWNRAEERDGDYVTVAHITPDRKITFYDKDMPHEVKQRIDSVANSSETRAFDFAPAPENVPPSLGAGGVPFSVHEAIKRQAYESQSETSEVTGQPETAEPSFKVNPDLPLPDPNISISDMNDYGYVWEGMLPLTQEVAEKLFDDGHVIFCVYNDDTEGMIYDREEIAAHAARDGLFGIEAPDWERSPALAARLAELTAAEGSREADLLFGVGNKFGIYQVKNGADFRDFRFSSIEELQSRGFDVQRQNYELVYTAPITERIEFLSDRYPVLNNIYTTFNTDHPPDYSGRSVSVSDIIVLKCNGDVYSHYVDKAGFVEIDSFLGEESAVLPEERAVSPDERVAASEQSAGQPQVLQAEVQTNSQDGNKPGYAESSDNTERKAYSGPTTAELEADIKAGKSISLIDLAKAVNAEQSGVQSQNPSSNLNQPAKQSPGQLNNQHGYQQGDVRNPSQSHHNSLPKGRPSLMERLEDGKRKAAQHGQAHGQTNPQKPNIKEARE